MVSTRFFTPQKSQLPPPPQLATPKKLCFHRPPQPTANDPKPACAELPNEPNPLRPIAPSPHRLPICVHPRPSAVPQALPNEPTVSTLVFCLLPAIYCLLPTLLSPITKRTQSS